jgi:hypothetical protein
MILSTQQVADYGFRISGGLVCFPVNATKLPEIVKDDVDRAMRLVRWHQAWASQHPHGSLAIQFRQAPARSSKLEPTLTY